MYPAEQSSAAALDCITSMDGADELPVQRPIVDDVSHVGVGVRIGVGVGGVGGVGGSQRPTIKRNKDSAGFNSQNTSVDEGTLTAEQQVRARRRHNPCHASH